MLFDPTLDIELPQSSGVEPTPLLERTGERLVASPSSTGLDAEPGEGGSARPTESQTSIETPTSNGSSSWLWLGLAVVLCSAAAIGVVVVRRTRT